MKEKFAEANQRGLITVYQTLERWFAFNGDRFEELQPRFSSQDCEVSHRQSRNNGHPTSPANRKGKKRK